MAQWRRVERLYLELPLARPGSLNAYLLAILIAGLATLLRIALQPWVPGVHFLTYFPAVILVALLCGFGAGLLSVVLSVAAAWFFVIPPKNSFEISSLADAIALAMFAAVSLVLALLIGIMRLAIGRHRELNRRLYRNVERRTEELHAAQAHLVQAQKMDSIGQLTGGIAHDFNNMLAVVLGNLDLAQRRIAAGRTDVSRQIDNAAEGAARAAALTKRLLAFSRRQPLAPQVTDLHRMLLDLIELLRRTLGESIRVEYASARDLWSVCVDPAQMESAIVNLAVNARDAMPGGGVLRIETENVELPAGDRNGGGEFVALRIIDTGCGMSPAVAERAIEPFFTTKEIGRGTGLGLSQVYGFLRQSGGDVRIDSREGEGTTVHLYLPRHSGEAPAPPPEQSDHTLPRGRAGEVVLVVEDEDQVRRTTVEALLELGYGVREARGGLEALAILANDAAVELMLTDIVMPGLDGYQLAERALRQRPELKLLYPSGYTRESGPAGQEVPPAELLQKPFTLDQLAAAVRRTLDG